MKPRKFKQLIEQASRLSLRQRAGLAELLNRMPFSFVANGIQGLIARRQPQM